jgi:hypothetical protein
MDNRTAPQIIADLSRRNDSLEAHVRGLATKLSAYECVNKVPMPPVRWSNIDAPDVGKLVREGRIQKLQCQTFICDTYYANRYESELLSVMLKHLEKQITISSQETREGLVYTASIIIGEIHA